MNDMTIMLTIVIIIVNTYNNSPWHNTYVCTYVLHALCGLELGSIRTCWYVRMYVCTYIRTYVVTGLLPVSDLKGGEVLACKRASLNHGQVLTPGCKGFCAFSKDSV